MPLNDRLECSEDPALSLCKRTVCVNDECVIDPTQFGVDNCICGVCTECDETTPNCGANCMFDTWDNAKYRPKANSLLLAVPCEYDTLTAEVGIGCVPVEFTRGEDGFFNITQPSFCCKSTGCRLQPNVYIYNYGNPPNYIVTPGCYCWEDGTWSIHTSCSAPLYVGQAWGPQKDVIIMGYCVIVGNEPGKCGYLGEPDKRRSGRIARKSSSEFLGIYNSLALPEHCSIICANIRET